VLTKFHQHGFTQKIGIKLPRFCKLDNSFSNFVKLKIEARAAKACLERPAVRAFSNATSILCIAAYGSERETIPPSGDRATTMFPQFALREGYQPRGFAVAA
jgi:hypothetical protein